MVKIVNRKYTKSAYNKKGTHKKKDTNKKNGNRVNKKFIKEKVKKIEGKLPEFNQLIDKKNFDINYVKSLSNQILSKSNSRDIKKNKITQLLQYINKNPMDFIIKKVVIKAIQYSLKYSDNSIRNSILILLKKTYWNIFKSPLGREFMFKLLKYMEFKQINTIYLEIIPWIIKYLNEKTSPLLGSKIFLQLNNKQRELLFLHFLKLHTFNPNVSSNDETLINLISDKLDHFIQFIIHFINTSIKQQYICSNYFGFIINTFCNKIPLNRLNEIISLFNEDIILQLTDDKHGIFLVCRYLRICSFEKYQIILSKLNDTTKISLDKYYFILNITSLFNQNQVELFQETILKKYFDEFDHLFNFQGFQILISHIIYPLNKCLIPKDIINFIQHLDIISNTPNSSQLYSSYQNVILPFLIDYFINNLKTTLLCNYKSNILLLIIKQHHNINDIYQHIALLTNDNPNGLPFFHSKQSNWFFFRLLHEDRAHGEEFLTILSDIFSNESVNYWKSYPSTLSIINEINKNSSCIIPSIKKINI